MAPPRRKKPADPWPPNPPPGPPELSVGEPGSAPSGASMVAVGVAEAALESFSEFVRPEGCIPFIQPDPAVGEGVVHSPERAAPLINLLPPTPLPAGSNVARARLAFEGLEPPATPRFARREIANTPTSPVPANQSSPFIAPPGLPPPPTAQGLSPSPMAIGNLLRASPEPALPVAADPRLMMAGQAAPMTSKARGKQRLFASASEGSSGRSSGELTTGLTKDSINGSASHSLPALTTDDDVGPSDTRFSTSTSQEEGECMSDSSAYDDDSHDRYPMSPDAARAMNDEIHRRIRGPREGFCGFVPLDTLEIVIAIDDGDSNKIGEIVKPRVPGSGGQRVILSGHTTKILGQGASSTAHLVKLNLRRAGAIADWIWDNRDVFPPFDPLRDDDAKVVLKVTRSDPRLPTVPSWSWTREMAFLEHLRYHGVQGVMRLLGAWYDSAKKEHYSIVSYGGPPLDNYSLEHLVRTREPLNEKEFLFFAQRVLTIVDDLHRVGIVHGDLKPGNLCVIRERDPDGHRLLWPTLIDFDLAEPIPWNAQGVLCGWTPGYMPPEQHAIRQDGRADVYTVGLILLELLTEGRPGGRAWEVFYSNPLTVAWVLDEARRLKIFRPDVLDFIERAVHPDIGSRVHASQLLSGPPFRRGLPHGGVNPVAPRRKRKARHSEGTEIQAKKRSGFPAPRPAAFKRLYEDTPGRLRRRDNLAISEPMRERRAGAPSPPPASPPRAALEETTQEQCRALVIFSMPDYVEGVRQKQREEEAKAWKLYRRNPRWFWETMNQAEAMRQLQEKYEALERELEEMKQRDKRELEEMKQRCEGLERDKQNLEIQAAVAEERLARFQRGLASKETANVAREAGPLRNIQAGTSNASPTALGAGEEGGRTTGSDDISSAGQASRDVHSPVVSDNASGEMTSGEASRAEPSTGTSGPSGSNTTPPTTPEITPSVDAGCSLTSSVEDIVLAPRLMKRKRGRAAVDDVADSLQPSRDSDIVPAGKRHRAMDSHTVSAGEELLAASANMPMAEPSNVAPAPSPNEGQSSDGHSNSTRQAEQPRVIPGHTAAAVDTSAAGPSLAVAAPPTPMRTRSRRLVRRRDVNETVDEGVVRGAKRGRAARPADKAPLATPPTTYRKVKARRVSRSSAVDESGLPPPAQLAVPEPSRLRPQREAAKKAVAALSIMSSKMSVARSKSRKKPASRQTTPIKEPQTPRYLQPTKATMARQKRNATGGRAAKVAKGREPTLPMRQTRSRSRAA